MRGLVSGARTLLRSRFAKSEDGATALEFAMVGGPFFLVLCCVFETGLMLFTEYVLQTSVQDAARQVRTGQAQDAGYDANEFKAQICDTAGIIIDCMTDVTVYVKPATNFTTLRAQVPSYLSIGVADDGSAGPSSYNCGAPSQATAVVATYDWDFTFPFMDFLGNIQGGSKRRLGGIAIFKNEPFPGGTTCS